jgi:rsbT co-antagonist protein RsbR
MLQFVLICVLIIGLTTLATLVSLRSWHERPARLFLIVSILLVIISIGSYAQIEFSRSNEIYIWRAVFICGLAGFTPALLGLLSALFMPGWWEGRKPIRWIGAPYIAATLMLMVDLAAQSGVFTTGLLISEERVSFQLTAAGRILLVVFTLSWLPHLVLLIVAAIRTAHLRGVIAIQFLAIIVTIAFAFIGQRIGVPTSLSGPLSLIPIPAALAYAVVRTRLLNPIQAATDLVLQTMSDAVLVLNPIGAVVFHNQRAADIGLSKAVLPEASSFNLQLGDRNLVVSVSELRDARGALQGRLILGRDITDSERRTAQLEYERTQLQNTLHALDTEQRERQQLSNTLVRISLPIIPVLPGILVLPVIGILDSQRIGDLQQALLPAIQRQQTRLVLIDITGISLLDQTGVAGLSTTINAAQLLGAQCVLVGVRPDIAQSLVAQGLPTQLRTAASLQEALLAELHLRAESV